MRGKSGALAVIVVCVNDAVVAADDALPADDLRTLMDTRLDELIANLKAARAERRKGKEHVARVTWDEIGER